MSRLRDGAINKTCQLTQESRQAQGKSRAVFNRTNDNVEWACWTWNPVTGCQHGCSYCYARDIAARFYGNGGFEPKFHPDRLSAPGNTRPPKPGEPIGERNVFVCSMADYRGYVFEHILVMERVLGRPILLSEAIHHIDGIRHNNIPGNLILFATKSMHRKYHARQSREIQSAHRGDVQAAGGRENPGIL